MEGKFIKVDPRKFLNDLIPVDVPVRVEKTQNKKGNRKKDIKKTTGKQKQRTQNLRQMFSQLDLTTEQTLQQSFINCINENNCCPGYKLIDTKDRPDGYDDTKHGVDACLFRTDDIPQLNLDGSQHTSPNWDLYRLHVEFKLSDADDAFVDNGDVDDFASEVLADEQQDTRGQIISYAALTFEYQHRCFFYTLLVMGPYVRILRWDRSGVIVTEKFDYQQKPEILHEFLKRFSCLTSTEQGIDDTVTVATDEDRRRMEEAASDENKLDFRDYARVYFKQSLDPKRKWWKIAMHMARSEGDGQGSVRYFLVGTTHFCSRSIAGRGTRGYVALDLEFFSKPDAKPHEKFVWLKDAWREKGEAMMQEGDILRKLNADDSTNVPRLLCHGDVPEQRMPTQSLSSGHSEDSTSNAYVHYRMVVEEVGRPLKDFVTGKELVMIVSDCVVAHWQAYKFSKILHRDVSVGNILMVEVHGSESRWEGYLTDWELSMPLGQVWPRQPHRTGTWQFMSVLLLMKPQSEVYCSFQDDLESFFHVLLYMGVRYLKHNIKDVGSFMYNFFDAANHINGRMVCGTYKANAMRHGKIFHDKQLQFLPFSSRQPRDVETYAPGRRDHPEDVCDHYQPDQSAASDEPSTPEGPAELLNPHPLNAILYELLSWFKARYAKHWPRERLRTPPGVANATPWGTDERRRKIWLTLVEDVERTTPEVHEEPPEDTSLAIKLNSHGPFAMLLLKWIGVDGRLWPMDDKSYEDQLLSGYEYCRPAAYYCSTPRPQKRTLEVETEPEEASPPKRVRSTQASSSKPLPASETSQPLKARRIRGKKRAKRS